MGVAYRRGRSKWPLRTPEKFGCVDSRFASRTAKPFAKGLGVGIYTFLRVNVAGFSHSHYRGCFEVVFPCSPILCLWLRNIRVWIKQLSVRKHTSAAKVLAKITPATEVAPAESSNQKPPVQEQGITPRSQDFNAWYLDDYLNIKFKETGHSNMYFPQFIPYSFIEKEASHVEGFSPELALVTVGGGKELEEKLVVRPTSETIVNHMFTQWIQSYRDLPLMINQWANVTRWEMRTKPFIRTLEFLWQEGHTAHATPEEAEREAMQMIDVYTKFSYEQAAIPVIPGRKSRVETFAGADRTYTIEAMMGDRKALQAGTSHNLGQNFSRAFGTQFADENGQRQHVWQTSWAISTRFVGGIIMTHGDDVGLVLPPRLASVQVVIVPIWKKANEKNEVLEAALSVKDILHTAGIKVKLDDSDQRTPGWKFNFWEMKGVPLRIEIGPRDVSSRSVVISRRDIPGKPGKIFGISMESSFLIPYIKEKLDEIQSSLLDKAITFRDSNIVDVNSYDELKEAISQGKWARGPWIGSDEDELKVKEETGATVRCFPFDQPPGPKKCLMTGGPADEVAIFAKSY
ncbi:hypothetical protein E3N88_12697 [Mikania micrantha]|uniref:proline--tRNA ligase n=1 Tax=Mikania micrantha TaxID=192012 RepID=A0A5N6P7K5_9ASTR|nr:hypothetical protein E3N88_12697 [Mikania micrantha]